MTYKDFCAAHNVRIWSAKSTAPNRWRIIITHQDGSRHQMTLTVRSRQRPEAQAILRALCEEARRFEATSDLAAWDNQRKLMRFLGEELYWLALECRE